MPRSVLSEQLPQLVRIARLGDGEARENVSELSLDNLGVLGVLELDSESERADGELTLPPPLLDLVEKQLDVAPVGSERSSSLRVLEVGLSSRDGSDVRVDAVLLVVEVFQLSSDRVPSLVETFEAVLEDREASLGLVDEVVDLLQTRRTRGRSVELFAGEERFEVKQKLLTSIRSCRAAFSALLSTSSRLVSSSTCLW